MIENVRYIKLQEVIARCLRHPLLQDVDLDAAIQYAIDFIRVMGMPDLFENKEVIVPITDYRGLLPCDLIAVNQVKELKSGICLRSTTDTFDPDEGRCGCHRHCEETFRTQNTVIITSFKEGAVKINYRAIPIDENGYPLLVDNPIFIRALEAYIKKEVFTILFDQDKIKAPVLQNAQQDYAWKAGQAQNAFSIPSESEMESICRSWTTLIPRMREFDSGWKNLGNREFIRNH